MESDTVSESRRFRKRDIFYLAVFILLVLSVVSHSAQDLAVLAGGTSEPIQNWIGYGGAYVSRFLFFTFGLAVYPLMIVAGLSIIRSFMPYPLKRNGYGYGWAFLALAFGLVLLYGLYPGNETFLQMTDKLGIGRNTETVKNSALSGGLIGQLFSAPEVPGQVPAGLLRRFISEIGTLVVSFALIIFSAIARNPRALFAKPFRLPCICRRFASKPHRSARGAFFESAFRGVSATPRPASSI